MKTLSINKRVTANGEFPGIVSLVLGMDKRMNEKGQTFGGVTRSEAVHKLRAKAYELGSISTFVMASKRMRRDGALIGVGKYLKNEN